MSTTRLIADRFSFNTKHSLGQGGMGTVYRGKDTQTGDYIAVKSLRQDILSQNPEVVKRFQREGEALSQLNHPNIVKMLTYCDDENEHYLVMEYVGGGSLYDLLQEQSQLSVQRALYIALDLADALTRAHRLNILHRDIKPANVLLAEDGTPRLTDFGMALMEQSHVTQSGVIVGTLAYLSPEALNGEELDERTDIWAYGVMLYEMLAGRRPFDHERAGPLISMILTQSVPDLETLRPDLPTALVDLIYRMLIKDRNTRISSIRIVGAELEAIIRGTSTTTMQPVVIDDLSGRFDTTTQASVVTDELVVLHNLPQQPTQFVGRTEELAALRQQLLRQDQRLITILGPGGMGKTRLAIELGRELLGDFVDGVFLVPLAPIEDPNLIVQAIAENAHFTFGQGESPKTQLFNYLREKSMLLILDNFEHMVDQAGLVAEMLSEAPNIRVIATSRERLRLRGENVFDLQAMTLPEHSDSVDKLLEYPIIQLFSQSARRIRPDFKIDAETSQDVVTIVHMVQGLPLGVELAAGWLEMLEIAEISQEIENSLDFLETDLRDVPERHRSIRAVFDYSWNLLSEDEQQVFMKLSVFRGGFEREAAQKIAGASLRSLTGLINKSLLHRDSMGRYTMNKLLRQYAEERLASDGTVTSACAEHAMYYAEFLRRLEPAFGTKNERKAIDAIEMEFQNVHMAFDWAIKNGAWEKIDDLLQTIMLFHQVRSLLQQGAELFNRLAEALQADGEGNGRLYWRARIRQALLAGRLGNYQLTTKYMPDAQRFFHESGEIVEESYTLNIMGYANMMQGNLKKSRDQVKQALALLGESHQCTDIWFFGVGNLGYIEYLAGNYQEASQIYEGLLAEGEKDYSPIGFAFGLNNLGEVVRAMGDVKRAQALFTEAYEIFKSFNSRRGMAFTLNNLAGVHSIIGNYDIAKSKYEKAYEINRDIGDLLGMGHSISALGNTAFYSGELTEAKHCFEQSLKIRQQMGNQKGVAESMMDLASVSLALGDYEAANRIYDETLALQRHIGDRQGEGMSLSMRGLAMFMSDDMVPLEDVKALFEEALQIGQDLNDMTITVQSLSGLAEYHLRSEAFGAAKALFIRVLKLNQTIHYYALTLFSLSGLAEIFAAEGDEETAFKLAYVVISNPDTMKLIPITQDRANEILSRLREKLPRSVLNALQEQVQDHTPDQVALDFLQSTAQVE